MPEPRLLTFAQALHEAQVQAMEEDPGVILFGLGVDDHRGIFGSTAGLHERFGPDRVFDTPIAEAGMTGFAIGCALRGLRPVHVHIRMDFLYLAMDQICNNAAKWSYMFGGRMSVPLVIRAVIGRSWGQGAQHSQSLQALFAHVPGLKVVMPATAADAKGLLLSAIRDPNPVLMFEHRLLYDTVDEVPEGSQGIPLGEAEIIRPGRDITVAATSAMVIEALEAAAFLEERSGISVEVVNLRSLVPLDRDTVLGSVRKTGRFLAADTGWQTCGFGAELCAVVAEQAFDALRAPPRRVAMAQTPCPTCKPLEDLFYPNVATLVDLAHDLMGTPADQRIRPTPEEQRALRHTFKGPF